LQLDRYSMPEAVFQGVESKDVASRLASLCMDRRWGVVSQTDTQVVCQTPPDGLIQAVQNLSGPRGAQLKGFVRYSLVAVPPSVRVQAFGYSEQVNAFGQVKQYATGGVSPDDLQDTLISIGGAYPPNAALRGNDIGVRGFINKENGMVGLKVTTLTPNGVAAAAGMQIGDRIVRIDGKALGIEDMSFRARLAKPKPGTMIALTVDRAGQPLEVRVEARPWIIR